MTTITVLKIQHAHAMRRKDVAEAEKIRKELAKNKVIARWLSDDVLVWEHESIKQKPRRLLAECYEGVYCAECGAPVERTGKRGKPPTKCRKHR